MMYHGRILSCTFLRRGTDRFIYVSDEDGTPLFHPEEWRLQGARCRELYEEYLDKVTFHGWTKVGTWPVGEKPVDWTLDT